MHAARSSVLRLLPLLLGAGCVSTPLPGDQTAQPTARDSAGTTTDTSVLAESMGPSALARRLSSSARTFHPRDGSFVAQHLAFEATLQADGLLLQRRQGDAHSAVQLVVASWGRDLAPIHLAAQPAEPGACTPAIGADGRCIQRIERTHPGLDEWWVALSSGVEFGFDLYDRPAGDAPIVITLVADGAAFETDGETAWFTDELGGLWTLSGTVAWDADGQPLDILLDTDDPDRLLLVVDDTAARWPITIDPVISTADATLSDGSIGNRHGHSVAGVGDIDNDGFDDVVVGAPTGTESVYVYYGSTSGLASTPDDTISSPLGGTDDDWGWDVAGAGDINNDGFMDVIVGARLYDAQDGAAYLFLGTTSGLATSGTELGEGTASQYGYAVGSAGDVNDDGFDDIIVGAPADSGGSAYVYHGSVSGIATAASTTVRAGADSARLGAAVSSAGDVNGDGYADILIGDPDSTGFAGQFHIHQGSDVGVSSSADTTVTASVGSSFLGTTVDGVGDVNGDGYDDVVVGAIGNAPSVQCYAEVYEGTSTGLDTTAAVTLIDTLGSSCGVAAGAGDVNGDDFSDILVGSPTAGPSDIGAASIFLGSPGGIQSASESTVVGTSADEGLGVAVSGAGDVNGDDFDDMLVSSDVDFDETLVFHGSATDVDGDGFSSDVDCDDTNTAVNPSRAEQPGDEIDSDCDGVELCYADLDGDGFTDGTVSSADIDCSGFGEATSPTNTADCDDTNASIFPGATELVGDQIDSDCDNRELCYADADGDTFTDGLISSADLDCRDSGETSIISTLTDCDDDDATVYPGAPELPGDEVDSDCDGGEICYEDLDGDTFTTGLTTSADTDCDDTGEASSESAELDCDDTDTAINPAATEITGDEIDSDCDGTEICYADADGDGYTRGIVGSSDTDCQDSGESSTETAQLDCDD